MIKVDRSRVRPPSILAIDPNSPGQRELAEARAFFRRPLSVRRQERFHFKVYMHREVRDALMELFHGKCAYCESKIAATQTGDIEHFRPKGSVVESPDHPGYWWLANIWENILISCMACGRSQVQEGVNGGKANRFPLEDERMRAFKEGEETRERPLLINPCEDTPEEHLVFNDDGTVVSETLRGKTTITVLGLNRKMLIDERAGAARDVHRLIASLRSMEHSLIDSPADASTGTRFRELIDELRENAEPWTEYTALRRQIILPELQRLTEIAKDQLQKDPWKKAGETEADPWESKPTGSKDPWETVFERDRDPWESMTPKLTKSRKQQVKASFDAFQQVQSTYSLEDEEGRETYRLQRRFIERIVIKNIKAIRELDLDFTTTEGARTQWMMLLGENGTGKSTVLQAVALALIGGEAFRNLAETRGVHPGDFVRYRCKQGIVKVKLSGFMKPHQLKFRETRVEFTSPTGETTTIVFEKGKARIEGTSWEPQTVLLGYGATRLLPRGLADRERSTLSGVYSRVDNLFDPYVPLFDAQKWLSSLDRAQFDSTALILKDLLALDDGKLIRKDGRIYFKGGTSKIPLYQLSDGYQSVLAMTVDILEVALRLWPRLEDAEGIVLIDEVGAHLHPTWKMRIVEALRRALPGIQFIATTHQPLCLRGLGAGEVVVMRRDERSLVYAITDLPSPSDFRVDQLLTSEFFGLNSTIDPEVEAIFDRYYALMADKERSDEEEKEFSELRNQLKDRRHLGTTLREQLMYEAVDQLVAQQQFKVRRPLPKLKKEAVEQVSEIWQRVLTKAKDGDV